MSRLRPKVKADKARVVNEEMVMKFEITKQQKIILAVFVVFLVAVCYGVVKKNTSSASRTSSDKVSAVKNGQAETKQKEIVGSEPAAEVGFVGLIGQVGTQVFGYELIADRNVFKQAVSSPPEVAVLPAPDLEPPPPLEDLPPMTVETPRDIAVTGIIKTGSGAYVLIEKPDTRESSFVTLGELAFGYTVDAVNADTVELGSNGYTHVLHVGANKSEKKATVRSRSSSSSSRGGSSARDGSGRGSGGTGRSGWRGRRNRENGSESEGGNDRRSMWQGMGEAFRAMRQGDSAPSGSPNWMSNLPQETRDRIQSRMDQMHGD